MTQQQITDGWSDEKIDDHVRYHSYMGMSEYQMADRAFKGAGASVIETHYVKIFMRKMRNEYEAALAARDERIKALQAQLVNHEDDRYLWGRVTEERKRLEARVAQLEAEVEIKTHSNKALVQGELSYREEVKQLRQQLAEAQRWEPVEDDWSYASDETITLRVKAEGGTLVTTDYAVYGSPLPNINHHYLPPTIRLCRLADAAQT